MTGMFSSLKYPQKHILNFSLFFFQLTEQTNVQTKSGRECGTLNKSDNTTYSTMK